MDEHAKDLSQALQFFWDTNSWKIIGIVLLLFFHNEVRAIAAMLSWKMGRRYNETDVVVINGYYARIVRIGLLYTEFYIYDRVDEPPNQGWTKLVANEELTKQDIWKPLDKHDMTIPIKKVTARKVTE